MHPHKPTNKTFPLKDIILAKDSLQAEKKKSSENYSRKEELQAINM